jgi:uncharacterized phiE125 gp8 family phage protein
MALLLITPPAAEPVSLAELKAWCRVDASDQDELIGGLGIAAREYVEQALGRQLVTATYDLVLDAFPADAIAIPRPPLQSIVSVEYDDRDGVVQTVPSDRYYVDAASLDVGWIVPLASAPWPATLDAINTVRARFVAGYGDPNDVPERIKIAIKGLAAWWFEQPEAVGGVVGETVDGVGSTQRARGPAPLHVRSLINQARVWGLS